MAADFLRERPVQNHIRLYFVSFAMQIQSFTVLNECMNSEIFKQDKILLRCK